MEQNEESRNRPTHTLKIDFFFALANDFQQRCQSNLSITIVKKKLLHHYILAKKLFDNWNKILFSIALLHTWDIFTNKLTKYERWLYQKSHNITNRSYGQLIVKKTAKLIHWGKKQSL